MTGSGISSSNFESRFASGETSSINSLVSEPQTEQSRSSSSGVTLLQRRLSSGSNRQSFSDSNLPAEIKDQPTSSTTADNQPALKMPHLPDEMWMQVGEFLELRDALKMRSVSSRMEQIFNEKVPYISIKNLRVLDSALTLFKKMRGRAGLEIAGIQCTVETFKIVFEEAKHLKLNRVSFTKEDIPEECCLAKFKSLYLNANLPWDVVVALLKKISPEELETLTLKFYGQLSSEQIDEIAQLSKFYNLKKVMIEAPGFSGAAVVALVKNLLPENLEELHFIFNGPLSSEQIAQLPTFPNLKNFVINVCGLSEVDVAMLVTKISAENLEELELIFDGSLSSQKIAKLPNFPNLKRALIEAGNLSGADVVALVEKVLSKKLEKLGLIFNGSLSVEEVAQLSNSSALKELWINATNCSKSALALLKKLSSEKLETLHLRLNGSLSVEEEEEIEEIAQLPDFSALKELLINATDGSKSAFALLKKVSPNKLETLRLILNDSLSIEEEEEREEITQLSDFPALKELLINATHFSKSALALLKKASPKKLEMLGLMLNGSFSPEEIVKLPEFPALKGLILQNSNFSGAAIAGLLHKVSKKLKRLNLNHCGPLSAKDINAFPNFPALETVYASGIKFSFDQDKQLFQHFSTLAAQLLLYFSIQIEQVPQYFSGQAEQLLEYFSNLTKQALQYFSAQTEQAFQQKINPNGLVTIVR